MTQLSEARRGVVTEVMHRAAHDEGVSPETLRELVARGRAVLPANPAHTSLRPLAIGQGLRVKVNANIGTSPDDADPDAEMLKLRAALEAGADAVMDLSTGGDLEAIRRRVIETSPAPVGTVPIYEASAQALASGAEDPSEFEPNALFETIERHARQGVDFVTVHCGVTRRAVGLLRSQGRLLDIVSRGGSFLAARIARTGEENPLHERYEDLLDIARAHDVTLSLGDGMRPGCLADAGDRAQVEELVVLGELVRRARDAGVQVMVEGPGHVALDQVRANVEMQKTVCDGAPFYVLGPIVTDVAPGYDHIAGAIGGALAAWAGADFLCYVTPAEHLGLPSPADVRAGVMASRVAAHAADIARGCPGARATDDAMAVARRELDWERQAELALDPTVVCAWRKLRADSGRASDEEDPCSMCGKFCAVKVTSRALRSGAV